MTRLVKCTRIIHQIPLFLHTSRTDNSDRVHAGQFPEHDPPLGIRCQNCRDRLNKILVLERYTNCPTIPRLTGFSQHIYNVLLSRPP